MNGVLLQRAGRAVLLVLRRFLQQQQQRWQSRHQHVWPSASSGARQCSVYSLVAKLLLLTVLTAGRFCGVPVNAALSCAVVHCAELRLRVWCAVLLLLALRLRLRLHVE
jgi:hypothetical protein